MSLIVWYLRLSLDSCCFI